MKCWLPLALLGLLFISCQNVEKESFLQTNLKNDELLFVGEQAQLELQASDDIRSLEVQFEGQPSLVLKKRPFIFNWTPAIEEEDKSLHFYGMDESGEKVKVLIRQVDVVLRPELIVSSPSQGEVIDAGQEFPFNALIQGDGKRFVIYQNDIKSTDGEIFSNDLSVPLSAPAQGKVVNFKIVILDSLDRVLTEKKINYQLKNTIGGGQDHFDFPAPSGSMLGGKRSLWATYYYLPEVNTVSKGYPLRDLKGNRLGPVLSKKHWCFAAMEGSVRVLTQGKGVTYNYAGTSSSHKVNCKKYFSWNVSKTKFRLANGRFGDGVRGYRLRPFRTVAVDKRKIPYGSVLYIPQARGQKLTLPNGDTAIHDGYFFAGDTGGAIKGTHIDVFIGVAKKNPFSWVKSKSSGTFSAYLVKDRSIIDELTKAHTTP